MSKEDIVLQEKSVCLPGVTLDGKIKRFFGLCIAPVSSINTLYLFNFFDGCCR